MYVSFCNMLILISTEFPKNILLSFLSYFHLQWGAVKIWCIKFVFGLYHGNVYKITQCL